MSSEPDSFSPLASVVFLGIADFARKSVSEQARLRAQLDAAVAAGIAVLNEQDRVVLDAPDGAAIVVLGNPPAALHAAQRVLATRFDIPLGVGINHGPVKLATGARNDSWLIGDGIDAAGIIAGFAPPNGVLVSRSYRDAVSAYAPTLAEELHPAGVFTDARIRAHELFSPDSAALPAKDRRQLVVAALACMAILALGVGARFALQSYIEARQPALLEFESRPPSEIYVDGVLMGKTPALSRLQVRPGEHTIEFRSGKFPPPTSLRWTSPPASRCGSNTHSATRHQNAVRCSTVSSFGNDESGPRTSRPLPRAGRTRARRDGRGPQGGGPFARTGGGHQSRAVVRR